MLDNTKRVINDIAEERNQNVKVVETVVHKMHEFVSNVIAEGSGKTIRLQKWGVFTPKFRIQHQLDEGLSLQEIKDNDQDTRYKRG
jgi:nucleoid DNA-binding protein